MRQRQVFVFSIFVLLAPSNAAGESRFNGDTSGRELERRGELNNGEQQLQVNLNAWQPLRGHNNWLILQATAATSMHRHQQPQQQQQQLEEQEEREQQQHGAQQQHRLPVNYYAYNHRYNPRSNSEISVAAGGNYKQVRPDLSYVLAISQTMRRGLPSDIDADENEDEASLRHQLTPPALKDVQEVDMRVGGQEVRRTDDFVALTNAPVDDIVNGLAKPSLPATTAVLDVDNYLAPFEQAVVKVRNFCDTLRSLINVDDGDDGTMETETEMATEEQEEEEQVQPARLTGEFEDID